MGAFTQMGVMLIICAVGFVGTKAMVLRREQVADITRLLINIGLPCMLLASVNDMENGVDIAQMGVAAVLSAVQFFLLMATAVICNVVMRTPKDQRMTYVFMSACTNVGFIGLPLISAIEGAQSVVFCGIFVALLGIFVYSIGFTLLAPPASGARRSIPWRSMLNPAAIASVISIALVLLHFEFPPVLHQALSLMGATTAPLAMLSVGIIIAGASLTGVVSEWRLYPAIVVRQLVVPGLSYAALRALGVDPLVSAVYTLMFGMPVGAMAPAFAQLVGHSPELPAKGMIISTVLAFATVPGLVLLMSAC